MKRITSKNTKPEMLVRSVAHGLGYRYRLHGKELPGKPDLVFRSRKSIIFVHGCFWHQHTGCPEGRLPKSRNQYWIPKLNRNIERDQIHLDSLRALGWRVLTIWECELKDTSTVASRIRRFLG